MALRWAPRIPIVLPQKSLCRVPTGVPSGTARSALARLLCRGARLVLFALVACALLGVTGKTAAAQNLRVDAGGGWSFYTKNLDLETTSGGNGTTQPQQFVLGVDLKSGPHYYVGAGFVRSIGKNFSLGVRLRGHVSRVRSDAECGDLPCRDPDGLLRVGSIEGRVILTSLDWIRPYLLVGLGVAHTSLEGVTVGGESGPSGPLTFPKVSILDAGGDVGLGATLPIAGGLALDAEIRATGSLPGGKENTITAAPFTLGLAYEM